ncbi:D-alanyl-D-alanine endopeptidase [Rhodocyclus tenuis]|uniref:D-alanyl-D-alanine endopeptidase n=1 Tax=Rhodocyclus tenuis TaxID=1066 RepID=A0A6L5JTA6_RHOTE|nr:D-alanyl-D-alanine endopeptidase [Rhodocyclus gracilis]MQY50623.1 D-alanyl-D-alanine endopeptidase [Rhodocyclus gracilis]MRD72627.1 D-alanyl-D-alanine endopeptidase [Rhodocyclus gracilis]
MRVKLLTAAVLALGLNVGVAGAAQDATNTSAHKKAKPSVSKPHAKAKAPAREQAKVATSAKVHAKHASNVRPVIASPADSGSASRLATRDSTVSVQSVSALVVDQGGGVIFEKNADVVAPIASITKLMTAMVVLDSAPDMQETITITEDDIDTLRGSRSRLAPGTTLTRETALLLALMSSENRAAHALARHYPGGMSAFVAAMNRKAASLGMKYTHFSDPTGLTSENVSTARDLSRMVSAAAHYPQIREFSTTANATAEIRGRSMEFNNTNRLVASNSWDIMLSKTGYIQEAGKCLVMQARVAEKPVVIVLLDSAGKLTRIGDANRIKRWMEGSSAQRKATTRA